MSENVMPMCCNTGWGNGLGAGVGGFLGAAFGSGGWGGGWNRGGFGYNTGLDNAILDGVNGVANSVNNLNTANLQVETVKTIAKKFGVSESAIKSIFQGRTWAHVK